MRIKDLFTYITSGACFVLMSSSCRSLRNASSNYLFPKREASSKADLPGQETGRRVYKGGITQASSRNASQILMTNPYLTINKDIEKSLEIQFKYAVYMEVPVEMLTDTTMLSFLDEWYGVPYRYGGSTKQGIDCSAFSSAMLSTVFGYQIPRTVREQYQACTLLTKEELREGDLVFFNTTGGVSHVGVFLMNNKFVHASVSSGVMISDLNEAYFSRRFLGGGRVIL